MKSSQQIFDELSAGSISGRQQKRMRFDHNESDDDHEHAPYDDNTPLEPISKDQFFLKPQQHSRRGRGHAQRGGAGYHNRTSFESKPRYSDNYDDIQRHYNENTSRNVTIKERTFSRIFQLRNLNNWIKSVLINSCITDAQRHLSQLAKESGVDPDNIYVPSTQPHWDRNIHSLFHMEQNIDGKWELVLNPLYPSLRNLYQKMSSEAGNDPGNNDETSAWDFESTAAIPHGYKKITQPQNVSILDFCGGKGGDLFKYMENHLSSYVLADIADVSVQSAIDRYNETLQKHRQRKKFFPCQFLAGNLSDARLHSYLHPRLTFDVVSCQFAFHYGFQTEQTLRRMLENVSDRLRPGGYFCGTIPDARVLFTKLGQQQSKYQQLVGIQSRTGNRSEQTGPLSRDQLLQRYNALTGDERKALEEHLAFGNEVYQVEFDLSPELYTWLQISSQSSDDYSHSRDYDAFLQLLTISAQQSDARADILPPCHGLQPFGIKYRFTLVEAVEGVPEYVVIFPVLCQIAAEYGLKPVLYENTLSYFKKMVDKHDNRDLLTKLRVFDSYGSNANSNQTLPLDQWEGVSVYCVFAFQKVGEITFKGETIYHDDIDDNITIPTTAALDSVMADSLHHAIDDWGHLRRPNPQEAGVIRNTPMHTEIRPIRPEELINIHEIERSMKEVDGTPTLGQD